MTITCVMVLTEILCRSLSVEEPATQTLHFTLKNQFQHLAASERWLACCWDWPATCAALAQVAAAFKMNRAYDKNQLSGVF